MSNIDRAAQFSSFEALTGHEEQIEEAARLTDGKLQLSPEETEALNSNMNYIIDNIALCPEADIIYFVPDERKEGGKPFGERKERKPFDGERKERKPFGGERGDRKPFGGKRDGKPFDKKRGERRNDRNDNREARNTKWGFDSEGRPFRRNSDED
jgi:hypothetical protein